MRDSTAKTECIGLADMIAAAYYGWCRLQNVEPMDVLHDGLVDTAHEAEAWHRLRYAAERLPKGKKS